MRKNSDIINAFLNKKQANNGRNSLHTDGNRLYSYSTCIAEHYSDGIVINVSKYSKTTSDHLKELQKVNPYIKLKVNNLPLGIKYLVGLNTVYEVVNR